MVKQRPECNLLYLDAKSNNIVFYCGCIIYFVIREKIYFYIDLYDKIFEFCTRFVVFLCTPDAEFQSCLYITMDSKRAKRSGKNQHRCYHDAICQLN